MKKWNDSIIFNKPLENIQNKRPVKFNPISTYLKKANLESKNFEYHVLFQFSH